MNILLIRHAQAVDDAPGLGDAGRWLTAKGRKVTRRVARWLNKRDRRRPTAIWTSPLGRAVQTAELIAAGVNHKDVIELCPELSPGHDPQALLQRLSDEAPDGVLAMVGHEPSLTMLAATLLGDVGLTGFKKCGVLGLAWNDGTAQLLFVLDPSRMKAKKAPKTSQRPHTMVIAQASAPEPFPQRPAETETDASLT